MGVTDCEGQARIYGLGWVVGAVAVAMSAYHLLTGYPGMGAPREEVHYPTHVMLALMVLFGDSAVQALAARRYLQVLWDAVLVAMLVASCTYLMFNAPYIANRFTYAEPLLEIEWVLGTSILVAVLEAARRTVGMILVWLTLAFFTYAMVGSHLPGLFYHQGFGADRIIEQSYMTVDGIWNAPVAVAANFIFLFVLFGSLLLSSGAGSFFTDLARALTGRTTGGPAKTAVVASAFMGMLSGSAAANVVTTGSFTIPAMKKVGYRPEFAAGVEAVASTGGQITPPIMGAAAFLMVEFAGVTYSEIILLAIIPAILYFVAVFAMVDLEARRLRLTPTVAEDLPSVGATLRQRGYLILPVVALLYFLFRGYTPSAAGFWSIVTLTGLVALMDPSSRRRMGRVVLEAMAEAPRMMAPITTACAVGGILAGIIIMTGLGAKMSAIILDLSGGTIIIALVLTMIAAIVLGMGMPTSGAYIILAALLGPGLTQLGIEKVGAHMFIIYCAAMSGITPPVAISSFAAAAIAGTNPWRTSLIAIKLGLSVYIIPYMFVYGPALLGLGSPTEIATTFVTAVIGVVSLSVAVIGWWRLPLLLHERGLVFAAAISMIYSGPVTDALGAALIATFFALLYLRVRQTKERPKPAADARE